MDYGDFKREFTQGDGHVFRFQVYDEISDPTGSVGVDITGWPKFWSTAKLSVADADPGVFQLTLGSEIVVVTPLIGVVEVSVPGAKTVGLGPRRFALVTDIKGEDAAGEEHTLARGQFIVLPAVTQAT